MTIVDKMTAAERLILTAVDMLGRKDDPLAVHVVASSALSLLRELVASQGNDYVSQVIKEGVYRSALAKIQGAPAGMPDSDILDSVVNSVAEGIEAGAVKSAGDIVIVASKKTVWSYLDYIFKPYNFLKHADRDPLATLDEADFDPEGAVVAISSVEFRLLMAFLEHPRQVLDRDRLLDMVQGREAHLFDRAVDNQISRLRRKIEVDSRNPVLIQTVWGGGYMLAADVRREPAGPGQ